MRPCEDWHEKIVRVLDNEAGDEEKRDVAGHLKVCASCREFHETFTRIRGVFKSVADPKAPPGIRQNLVQEIEANVDMQTSRSSSMFGHPRGRWYLSAAAVLIAGIAFLAGRLSAPRRLPLSEDLAPRASAEPDGVTVSSDLVAWLDAARLFDQLGMEDRMAEAVEYAGRLLPSIAVDASGIVGQNVSPIAGDIVENQNPRSILDEILRPHESVESVSGILAHSFGGYDYESEVD